MRHTNNHHEQCSFAKIDSSLKSSSSLLCEANLPLVSINKGCLCSFEIKPVPYKKFTTIENLM